MRFDCLRPESAQDAAYLLAHSAAKPAPDIRLKTRYDIFATMSGRLVCPKPFQRYAARQSTSFWWSCSIAYPVVVNIRSDRHGFIIFYPLSSYGSHALRGNPVRDAPASRTAERFKLYSHAERGNDEFMFRDVIVGHILSE